jgi:hypothetical protein
MQIFPVFACYIRQRSGKIFALQDPVCYPRWLSMGADKIAAALTASVSAAQGQRRVSAKTSLSDSTRISLWVREPDQAGANSRRKKTGAVSRAGRLSGEWPSIKESRNVCQWLRNGCARQDPNTKASDALLARVDPVADEIWDIRSIARHFYRLN